MMKQMLNHYQVQMSCEQILMYFFYPIFNTYFTTVFLIKNISKEIQLTILVLELSLSKIGFSRKSAHLLSMNNVNVIKYYYKA